MRWYNPVFTSRLASSFNPSRQFDRPNFQAGSDNGQQHYPLTRGDPFFSLIIEEKKKRTQQNSIREEIQSKRIVVSYYYSINIYYFSS